jgi:hypothetical protein
MLDDIINDNDGMYPDGMYPDVQNNTIIFENQEQNNIVIYGAALAILSFSLITACCKHSSRVTHRINNYRNKNRLNNFISNRESEEIETSPDVCSICIEPFAPRQMSITLPCYHKFHTGCILIWLKTDLSCPMCRAPIQLD